MDEKELENYLIRNLDIIEPDLELLHRQYQTKYGTVDLVCRDKNHDIVIIEIKVNANLDSPGQLARYLHGMKQKYPNKYIRAILVSPEITKSVWELCNFFNVDFKELDNIPSRLIDLNELDRLKTQSTRSFKDNKLENISFLHEKIIKVLQNFPEGTTTKNLASILYPNKKFNSVRSTLSTYTTNLKKLDLIKKQRLGRNTLLHLNVPKTFKNFQEYLSY